MSTLLQMIDAFSVVAFAQLLPDQAAHHDLHPLLPDDSILCLLQLLVVVVVDAVKGRGHGRLLGQESRRFGGRHCVWSTGMSSRLAYGGLRVAMRRLVASLESSMVVEGESRWSLGEGEWKCLDIQAGRSCSVTRRASTSRLGWTGPCAMELGSGSRYVPSVPRRPSFLLQGL